MSNVKNNMVNVCATLNNMNSFLSPADSVELDEIIKKLAAIGERHNTSNSEMWNSIDKSWFSVNKAIEKDVWKFLSGVTEWINYSEFEHFVKSNMDTSKDVVWNFSRINELHQEMLSAFPYPLTDDGGSQVPVYLFEEYTWKYVSICPPLEKFSMVDHRDKYYSWRENWDYFPMLSSYVARVLYMHLAFGFIRKALEEQ